MGRVIAGCYAEYPGCVYDLCELPELSTPAKWYRSKGGMAWVAHYGAELVGLVACGASTHDRIELFKLYVASSARGLRIGGKLIAQVESFALELSKRGVHLWSDTRFTLAHRVYEHLGYKRLPETRELHDLSNSVEFHFEKLLSP